MRYLFDAEPWQWEVRSDSWIFVLPLKKAVRKAEGIEVGEPVTVEVELVL